MAVFWFGWAKKLKNIFTKQQADTLYLQKNSNQLQQVSGLVDFTSNIVCKRNGYVDNVDTNGPTSMINKRYLEEQLAKFQLGIIYETGTGQLYQNSATINFNIWSSAYNQWDLTKPVYVCFSWYESNGSRLSRYTGILSFLGSDRGATQFVGTNYYINNGTVVNNTFAGVVFPYNQNAKVICPDTNKRVGYITIMGYKK